MNKYVEHFRDLEVYKKQRFLAGKVFRLSKSFPTACEEIGKMQDQFENSFSSRFRKANRLGMIKYGIKNQLASLNLLEEKAQSIGCWARYRTLPRLDDSKGQFIHILQLHTERRTTTVPGVTRR